MGRLFGTDGVRGRANADLTPELALAVARAAAGVLADRDGTSRPVAVVGRDPRASGEMLEAAVVAGLASAGAEVLRAGVLPTPAIAHLTASTGADLGVMISASHNPMPDNGIKLFSRGGHKLPDAVEAAIEQAVTAGDTTGHRPTGAGVGRVRDLAGAGDTYIEHLLSTVLQPLSGLTLVVDCAHGAAATVAPEVYRRAGATVHVIGGEPDGWNINDGIGSTHLGPLTEAVRAHGADLGIAHDGDADRCLAVTATGEVVDGDAILAVCALALKERGQLAGDTVVATVMSNLGFHHTMRAAGIAVHTTAVGDRYVLEALRDRELSLGGEQSGHLVFLDHATTGDGLLTGLSLLSRMAATGSPLAELASVVQRLPQTLVNVPVRDRLAVVESEEVADAVNACEAELGDDGRVLLRPSGTEQLVRVMVEAPTQEQADAIAARLAEIVASCS
ncbi:phosphoglucosamine mutase [Geodermatophilus sabuli]|uniref:Phosphoglucosamine mutase n=1 Tax=Geodermatophilus sabuli TaxID=1564158 RepID=A0A285E9M0_9ACTN|nr:phosphoglucosamine mutase [Geodermatophilus sabuli]MBB3084885.1 phosphoglucosamine mutase [Geodermatophilus sabuli]SNX95707.1 phosphoglucosamine mutase [Geodermatophilus sabuli]